MKELIAMKRAYVRVSTVEQNEDRQIEGLKRHGVDKWYTEKVSGKNTKDRKQFQLMLSELEEGDIVLVHDLSRLARSTKDLLEIVDILNEKHVSLVSNKENIDTNTPTGRLMLTMIGAIAEFERTNLLERQREGIAIAKRKGAYQNCGRKEKEIDQEKFSVCMAKLLAGAITKSAMAAELGVSRPTLNRILEKEVC